MPARAFVPVLYAAALLFAAGGCSFVPEAQSDPTRFYVLSSAASGVAPQPGAPVILLREVDLASYLRSRPLVVRRGNNEIEFREFSRWGEPLEQGIGRVLREELVSRGAASAVRMSGVRGQGVNQQYTLHVRVLACEGLANGEVSFHAGWELASTEGNLGKVTHGDYRATELRWDGKSEASLAAQLSQAVAGLAGDIAASLAKK